MLKYKIPQVFTLTRYTDSRAKRDEGVHVSTLSQ